MGRLGSYYREFAGSPRWTSFRVRVETSDIYARANGDYSELLQRLVGEARDAIRSQIARQEAFLTSFDPVPRMEAAHPAVEAMYRASEAADVGPMAAVAGAIAEYAGRALLERSAEVLVENGGDIWLSARGPVVLAVYAGGSRFTGGLGLRIAPERTPAGICTSSGRVGPSFSFGRADAATVIADDAALADAVATGAANRVRHEDDFEAAASYAMAVPGVRGVLIVLGDRLVAQGEVELAAL
ncbi:MAG TPA: UPF0280 family protein [Spirochaetota bacterium]|nr:UPF0280 family protein [Spirochaetota bacterium]OPZ37133.1 MAG: hypothetical protein BWY96_01862 [Spirochaetes bacterium ADurb.BinA120]HNU92390.1 UPF0280 family protein [Spirochaetota bacterium]HPI14900.1 UPF0280 family protein [Spirochaetota bacterium]